MKKNRPQHVKNLLPKAFDDFKNVNEPEGSPAHQAASSDPIAQAKTCACCHAPAVPKRKNLSTGKSATLWFLPCNCYDKNKEKEKKEKEKSFSKFLLKSSKIPPIFLKATLEPTGYPYEDTFLPICQQLVISLLEGDGAGRGLGFIGGIGIGKTHYICAVLLAILQKKRCLFLNIPDFYDDLKSCFSENTTIVYADLLDQAKNTAVVAFDDMGAEHTSQWAIGELAKIINHRYNYNLPTLFTSNLKEEELADRLGIRTFDRLKEMCKLYELDGASVRGKVRHKIHVKNI